MSGPPRRLCRPSQEEGRLLRGGGDLLGGGHGRLLGPDGAEGGGIVAVVVVVVWSDWSGGSERKNKGQKSRDNPRKYLNSSKLAYMFPYHMSPVASTCARQCRGKS